MSCFGCENEKENKPKQNVKCDKRKRTRREKKEEKKMKKNNNKEKRTE